jgi:hypothetical protein
MKNTKTIRIKNELPELLEAVCTHEDCPDWLNEAIWDAVNDKNGKLSFSADYFRYALANAETYEQALVRRMEVQNNESNQAS